MSLLLRLVSLFFVGLRFSMGYPTLDVNEITHHDAVNLKRLAPPSVGINSVTSSGTGCPAGSTSAVLGSDGLSITVIFSSFEAAAGPSTPASMNSESCSVVLGLTVTPGYAFGITTVDNRGYYQLDSNVATTHQTFYAYRVGPTTLAAGSASSSLVGPLAGGTYTYETVVTPLPVLAVCGGLGPSTFTVNNTISVSNANNRAGSGLVTQDSLDVGFRQEFRITFGSC